MRLGALSLLVPSFTLAAALTACVPKDDTSSDGTTEDSIVGVFTDEDGDGFDAIADGGEDCDDNNANVHPSADEVCDGVDNDCDGAADDGLSADYWPDSDGDGYGAGAPITSCEELGRGWAQVDGDCNDSDAAVYPDAEVECSDQDNNCDGLSDNADSDGDGFAGCEECDDARADAYPGASETCDDSDQDCDGVVDNDATDGATWSRDADGDGFGDPSSTVTACDAPSGYVADTQDCDDNDASTSPDAEEACDGLDNNCDGEIDGDSATGTRVWYADTDGDGYGDPSSTTDSCSQPSGFVTDNTDCDDTNPAMHPDALDTPYDGVDTDCAGGSDNDADQDGYDSDAYGGSDCDDSDAAVSPGASDTWYDGVDADCAGDSDYDADKDGYDSSGYGGADCDDNKASTYPGASDSFYDGVDADCAGDSDYDADKDGFDSSSYGGKDCDDSKSTTNPSASETFYDGVDTDCDGKSDYDADKDGYDSSSYGGKDCDDAVSTVSPAATEVYYDGVDQNCDSKSDYDADKDGYDSESYGGKDCDDAVSTVSPAATEVYYDGVDQNCDDASDYDADKDSYDSSSYGGKDCNDSKSTISPAATEVYYDGVDQNCDSKSDYDADLDGYDGTSYGGKDCNDSSSSISPVATEIPGDGVDQNCEGNDGPSVSLSSSSGTVVALEGYSTTSDLSLTVNNGGEGTLSWVATADASWVDLSDMSGSGGETITIGADAAGLSDGTYTATVTIEEATAGLDSDSFLVTLHVADTWSGSATTTITRDANGDEAAMVDATGLSFTITRDGNSRLTDMTASNGDYTTITYDAMGNPSDYENTEGVLSLDWTSEGGVDKITWPDAAVTDYTWDSSGRISGVTLPSGATLAYSYSSTQTLQPDSVTHSVGGKVTLTYDSSGRTKTRSTTRSKTTWTYDSTFGKVASITHANTSGTTTLKLAYTYNSRGLIATRALTDSSSTTTLTYTYDGNGRLTGISSSTGGSVSYTYDEAGNRSTMTVDGATTSYLYDSDDRLLQAGDEVFEYDQAGRMTRRISADGIVDYTWDAFGNLLQVDDGTDVVDYTYGGNGVRIGREHDGVSTRYYHDLSELIPHLHEAEIDDGSSVSTASFVRAGGSLAWVQVDSTGYATLVDHIGTVLGLANTGPIKDLRFGAFGDPEEAPSLDDPFLWMGFTGEETDPVTGLVYLRNRYYDPALGRFISPDQDSPDPGVVEDWNSYTYCENDPLNLIDPTGNVDWGTLGSGLVSVAAGIAGFAALAVSAPVTGPALAVAAIVGLSSASGLAFGLGQILAGATAPDGTKVEMPGGLLDIAGLIAKAQLAKDDVAMQNLVDAVVKAIDMAVPGPDKLAGIAADVAKALGNLDQIAKIKDIPDMWGKLLDTLKAQFPDTWKEMADWLSKQTGDIPADDERGGIYINATATVLADLSQVDGASVDPQTGQLVLYGKDGGITVDGIDGDMLFTALHWLYDSSVAGNAFTAPGVTIENDLIPPEEPTPPSSTDVYHGVGYFGGIEYTEMGFTAFEADRMLKSLNLGVDSNDTSISYDWIGDYVSAYESCVDIEDAYYDGTSPAGWVRFWIEPDQMILTLDSSRDALQFDAATMIIQYEDQTDTTQRWPAYDYWTTMLTANYDDIAEHVDSWEDLRTASKFIAIAYWLYEEDLYKTLDWNFINSYEEEYYDTPWWTLEGEVTSSFVYKGTTLTQTHKGGASMTTFGHGYQTDSSGDVQAVWDDIYDARPSDTDNSWSYTDDDGNTGTAVALPLGRVPMPGGAHQTVVDLWAPSIGDLPLELRRSYSSVLALAEKDMGLGAGWSVVPYSAEPSTLTYDSGTLVIPQTIEVYDHLAGEQLRFEWLGWDGVTAYFYADGHDDEITMDATGTYTWTQRHNRVVEFDEDGALQSVTDRAGHGLTYTWSGDQLTQIDHSGGHGITLSWDSQGRLTGASTDLGWTVSYAFDSSDRLDEVTNQGGLAWPMSYSSAGLLDEIQTPDGEVAWAATYDAFGRLLSESVFGHETEMAPSMLDGTVLSVDETGVYQQLSYDSNGRLIGVEDGEGGLWEMSWNSDGMLTELVDALGNSSSVSYDSYGLPWVLTDPEGLTTTLYWTWGYGQPVIYAYERKDGKAYYIARDTDGNPTSVYEATLTVASDGSLSGVSLSGTSQTMAWTSDGQLSSWSKGSLKATFTYTSDGQLATMKDLFGASRSYTYDSSGRMSKMTAATGETVSYTYDTVHPLLHKTISAGSTTLATFSYDSLGRLTQVTDAAGNSTAWTWGSDGLLSGVEAPEGGTLLVDRDAAGRITEVQGSWGMSRSWTYDDAGRVVSTTREVVLP